MFNKRAVNELTNQIEQTEAGERAQVILCRLRTLKDKVSALTHDCEELKKLISENECPTPIRPPKEPKKPDLGNQVSLCSECGNTIQPNQEVIVKDITGTEQRRYHMECFQTLLE